MFSHSKPGDTPLRKKTEQSGLIDTYKKLLLEYNQQTNLISRKTTSKTLNKLVAESLLLSNYVNTPSIVDAGSGNGILGIPLAIFNPDKRIFLVEAKEKKAYFLNLMVQDLELKNLEVFGMDLVGFFKSQKCVDACLCARGFPSLQPLIKILKKNLVKEVVVITSKTKIKKNLKTIENCGQKIYNIPLRDNLKILKLENVSRET